MTVNDLPVGRSVEETIRLVKAFQFTVCYTCFLNLFRVKLLTFFFSAQDEYGEVCPANWQEGGATILADPKGSLEYFASVNANGAPVKRKRLD